MSSNSLAAFVAGHQRVGAADVPRHVSPPPPATVDATADASAPTEVEIPATLTGRASFLCGLAGTGKTYLSTAWARQQDGVVLAASTGIASVNLGQGTTINALLKYFDTASLRDSYTMGSLTATLGKLHAAGTRRILLDEVSMVDGEQLTIISRALDELAGDGYILDERLADELETSSKAPRELALTVVGDFAQLPPVKAPFAFESAEWSRYAQATHKLTEIRRQTDQAFVAALHAARRGDATHVCDYFATRMCDRTDEAYDGPTILATNDAVSRYNALRMDALGGTPTFYTAKSWGKLRGDWKQIPERLALKPGALVMILANRRNEIDGGRDGAGAPLVYANGDLGHVVDLGKSHVVVKLQRTGQDVDVVPVTRQNTAPLEPGRRAALKLAGTPHLIQGKHEIIGEVTYLPVRVAYASTVHKTQGLSLDQVQVNIREHFFTAPSMVYVALSRARTVEGLRLVGSVDALRHRCTVNPKVAAWL